MSENLGLDYVVSLIVIMVLTKYKHGRYVIWFSEWPFVIHVDRGGRHCNSGTCAFRCNMIIR